MRLLTQIVALHVRTVAIEATENTPVRPRKNRPWHAHSAVWGMDWHREEQELWTEGAATFRRPGRELGAVPGRGGVPLPRFSSGIIIVAVGLRIDPDSVAAIWPTDTAPEKRKGGRPREAWWGILEAEFERRWRAGELCPKRGISLEAMMEDWLESRGISPKDGVLKRYSLNVFKFLKNPGEKPVSPRR